MDDETAVKILIENELNNFIKIIEENYTGKKAKKLIEDFKEDFKETVLKEYKVKDIDELINQTLDKVNNKKEEKK